MFITTANTLNIPPPLMDRMEIIRIAGYTEDEKVEIVRKHLIPNLTTKHGLDVKEWAIDDEALLTIIRRYTREAGVRDLERELSTLIRKAVKELILSEKKSMKASADNLADYLGVPKYRYGEIERLINDERRCGGCSGCGSPGLRFGIRASRRDEHLSWATAWRDVSARLGFGLAGPADQNSDGRYRARNASREPVDLRHLPHEPCNDYRLDMRRFVGGHVCRHRKSFDDGKLRAATALFDGGGMGGTASRTCAGGSSAGSVTTASPGTGTGSSVGPVGIPLGATEMGGAGISPPSVALTTNPSAPLVTPTPLTTPPSSVSPLISTLGSTTQCPPTATGIPPTAFAFGTPLRGSALGLAITRCEGAQ